MPSYTRRQILLLSLVVAFGATGLAIDRWRRANPDVVTYLESLDRAPAPAPSIPRRTAARRSDAPEAAPSSARGVARHDPVRGRRAGGDDSMPLDVNLASAAELERLPGVGPALAARIVEARTRDGPFGSVDDLRRVRGVGGVTLERLRPRLAVNTP
jgi:competence protein ComEA